MSHSAKTTSKTALAALGLILAVAGLLLHADVPQVPSNFWAPAGDLANVRAGATGTLLPNGLVLIAGGIDANGATSSAERFSPDGAHFIDAPAMQTPRVNHSATLLADGRVLVAGGTGAAGAANATAEIYDSAANAWLPAGSLNVARRGHTATRLPDGKVLIAGGDDNGVAINSLEVFDPDTALFTVVDGASTGARTLHAAAALLDGRVLIAGGFDGTNPLASTSIYDPETNSVTAGPDLSTPRSGLSATTLLDGRVLIAGGAGASGELATAETFDPATNALTPTDNALSSPRQNHLAFLLPHNNQVLIVGGLAGGNPVAAAEYFTPWEGTNGVFCAQAICASGYQGPAVPAGARAWAAGSALSFAADKTYRTGPNDGLLVLAGGSGQQSSELFGFATVTTDKDDYAPGTTVTIRGSGWQPHESVALVLRESPFFDEHPLLDVEADDNGNIISTEFVPDEHDLNIRFYLTAYGSASQARTTFTDAINANKIPNVGAQTPSPVSAGGSATYSVTVGFSGNGVSCTSVLATSPLPSGASASFTPVPAGNPANTITTITGEDVTTTLTVNTTAGMTPVTTTFTITASGGTCGGSASTNPAGTGGNAANPTLNISKANQTITFGALGAKTYGDADFSVSATASSGLLVSFASLTPSVCTVVGSTVHLLSQGSCTIRASQAGDSNYNAAPNVDQTFTVNPRPVTVTFTAADKFYDGTNVGAVSGCAIATGNLDGANLTCSVAGGTFATSNASTSAQTVSATATLTGSAAVKYTITNPVTTSAKINPKTLTASIVGNPTKPYDGNTNATLAAANFSLSGLVGSESFTVTKTSGAYNSKDVLTANSVTATLAPGDFTPASGTLASNYTLPTSASGAGHITVATVTASIIGDPTRPYNGNANATLTAANFSLSGLASGDGFTVTKTSGSYNSADVATATTVTASLSAGDFTAGMGTLATNYTLPTTASGPGHITGKAVTASIIGDPTRPYNGNTNATLTAANFSLSGLIGSDAFTITQTSGAYNSKDVATANTVTASLSAGDFTAAVGTVPTNYMLPTTASGSGHITTANITASIIGNPTKPFDGNTNATLAAANFSLSGLAVGEGFTVTKTTGSYNSPDVASATTVTASLAAGDFSPNPGTSAGNYALPTLASGPGHITRVLPTVSVTGGSFVFDLNQHAATGFAYGIGGVLDVLSPTLTFSYQGTNTTSYGPTGTAPTAVGTYQATGSFAGNSNYLPANNNASIAIAAWTEQGYFQPVDMTTGSTIVWNTVKGGSTVPLKFKIFAGGVEKTNVSAVSGFSLVAVMCGTGVDAPIDPSDLSTTGGTTLRYDGTAGQFIQNWQVPKPANQCYRAVMTAADGSQIANAFFKTK